MFRSSLLITMIAALGSVVSFLNQVVLARYFGAGSALDIYLLAISLPVTIMALAVGVLNYQLVPLLQARVTDTGSCDSMVRGLAIGLGAIGLGLAAMLSLVVQPFLLISHPELDHGALGSAVVISRIAFVWIPFAVICSIYTAAHHVQQRFFLATAAQTAPMIGSLLFCIFSAKLIGIQAIAWGQLAGFAFASLILASGAGFRKGGATEWSGIATLFRSAPLSLSALVIFTIYPLSDAFWGSRIGSSAVSYLGYAQRLIVGISGIAIFGASTAIFPKLARLAAEGSAAVFRKNLSLNLRLMLVVLAPLGLVLSFVAMPFVQVLFQRGAFDREDSVNLATILPWMLAGMVPMGCANILFKAFFSEKRAVIAATVSLGGTACYFSLSGVLSLLVGTVGVAIAYAVSWWVVFGAGILMIWRGQTKHHRLAVASFAGRLALAIAVAGAGMTVSSQFLPSTELGSRGMRIAVMSGSGFLGLILYIGCAVGPLGLVEVRMITDRLLQSMHRRTSR